MRGSSRVGVMPTRVPSACSQPHCCHGEEYHTESSRGSDLSDIMEEDEEELCSEMQLEDGGRRRPSGTSHSALKVSGWDSGSHPSPCPFAGAVGAAQGVSPCPWKLMDKISFFLTLSLPPGIPCPSDLSSSPKSQGRV